MADYCASTLRNTEAHSGVYGMGGGCALAGVDTEQNSRIYGMGGGLALAVKDTQSLSKTRNMSRLRPCCGTCTYMHHPTTPRRKGLVTSPTCLCRAKYLPSLNG